MTKEKRHGARNHFFILRGHMIGNRASHARRNRNDFPVWWCWLALSPPNLRCKHPHILTVEKENANKLKERNATFTPLTKGS